MTINNINVEDTVDRVKALIANEPDLSPAVKSSLEVMLLPVTLLAGRMGLSSRNSSKPSAADPYRRKKPARPEGRKPGGQPGHPGTTLRPVADPDEIVVIEADRRSLPPGTYREAGYEARQVADLDIKAVVTEYRAQILEDGQGLRYTAPFPVGLARPVQYGPGIKVNPVYLSACQLIPYQRVAEHFQKPLQIPPGSGSVCHFNQEAYDRLAGFEEWIKKRLAAAGLLPADETGVNVDGRRKWLHSLSNAGLLIIILMGSGGAKRKRRRASRPDFPARSAMTTGSRTSCIVRPAPCIKRITSGNWNGRMNRTGSSGRPG